MSELMRAMIGCVTLTTVVMMIFTFLMRSWLLKRLKRSIKIEYDVQLERLRTELRGEMRDECRRQLAERLSHRFAERTNAAHADAKHGVTRLV